MGSGGTGCEVCIRAVPRWSRRDRQRGVPRAAFPVPREGRCSPRADALAEERLGVSAAFLRLSRGGRFPARCGACPRAPAVSPRRDGQALAAAALQGWPCRVHLLWMFPPIPSRG